MSKYSLEPKHQGRVGIYDIEFVYIRDVHIYKKGNTMANREEGAPVPNCRQGQEQPQHQDAAGQRHIHLNWSNFKLEFSGKLEEDAGAHLL